ncbi:hypothetical protein GCM10025857_39400 [Alicyclobacillus contaminans]|nr:hypothetical protein GCM10025857_39400 [Alicyclobacillus contaminans]
MTRQIKRFLSKRRGTREYPRPQSTPPLAEIAIERNLATILAEARGGGRPTIEITTDFLQVRVTATERDEHHEWLHRHALHQLIRLYRKEYGTEATELLMQELNAYHTPRRSGIQ